MKPDDYELSMQVSRRGRRDSAELRQLMVNRLSNTLKTVLRRPLRGGQFGLFCEPCKKWWTRSSVDQLAVCGKCGRRYRVELVVYEEIKE